MGQTLTHGVYLPSEGERNCYNGLASNWRLLDGAIGTVAAHTTAIAGKADISHAHGNISNDGKVGTTANVPLITGTGGVVQAGSFGTSANTFCEGNDSRLSDARTPVAHTHTKSDVTDLLNSNFIPSANNSYDLGSSSYQWKSVYAQSYYYNGTEFQDKFVTLDTAQTITGEKTFSDGVFATGSKWSVTTNTTDDITYLGATFYIQQRNSGTLTDLSNGAWNVIQLGSLGLFIRNNNYGDIRYKHFYSGTLGRIHTLDSSGYEIINLVPAVTNTYDLGTSTNKWKSLNGINPGALSLPDYSRTMDIDTTNWSKNGNKTIFTPTLSGWLQITIPNDVDSQGDKSNYISLLDSGTNPMSGMANGNANDARIFLLFPVIANREYRIYIKSYSNTITTARIVQCQGNV